MLLQRLGDPGKTTFVAGAVQASEMTVTSFPVVWKYEANIVLADTTSSKIGQRNEALVCHRSPKSPSPLQAKAKQKVYVLLTPLRAEMPTLC